MKTDNRIRFPIPLLLLYGATLSFLLLVLVVSLRTGIPIWKFTVDPAALMDANPFTGVVSNIGVLAWCASAAVCFFSFALLRERGSDREFPTFLLFSGLITCLLLFDDFFQFHEYVYPRLFRIREKLAFGMYGLLVLLYLARFRKTIRETEYLPLLVSFGCFGVSVLFDRFPHKREVALLEWHYLYEDGAKLMGIVSWFAYFAGTAFRALRSSPGNPELREG